MSTVAAISPSRKAAFAILLNMERGGAHADELLRGRTLEALSPVDRNLATTLVLGVLRWQIRLDAQIQRLLKKPGARLDPEVLIALRLGAFQLQFLDRVPARAAIDESVELPKQSGHRFASGLVNAVLRKLASAGPSNILPESSAVELAVACAHPPWLVERWTDSYGLEATKAICRHGQAQPPFTVRITSTEVEAELTGAGLHFGSGALLSAARTVVSGGLTPTEPFHEGHVRIQDEGSQLIGELAARTGNALNHNQEKFLDACAAPGGKTLILADRNPQARIVACESNPRRFAELRKRLAAYADRVECRLADATELEEHSAFDLVLVDVPCSGTGTLGRNPEIRHRLHLEEFARYAERQRELLRAALRCVRPGGRVVYSTCSLEPEENEQVVSSVIEESQNARQVSLESRIAAMAKAEIITVGGAARLRDCLTPEGNLLLLPGTVPTDGFFVALIEKTG